MHQTNELKKMFQSFLVTYDMKEQYCIILNCLLSNENRQFLVSVVYYFYTRVRVRVFAATSPT